MYLQSCILCGCLLSSNVRDDEAGVGRRPDLAELFSRCGTPFRAVERLLRQEGTQLPHVALRSDATWIGRTRRLAAGLHFIEHAANVQRTHIRFVDDDELQTKDEEKVEAEEAGDDGEAVEEDVGEEEEVDGGPWLDPKVLRKRAKAYKELRLRQDRVAKLQSVAQDIATERKLRSKVVRYKVRGANVERGTPAVFKWKQQRKK